MQFSINLNGDITYSESIPLEYSGVVNDIAPWVAVMLNFTVSKLLSVGVLLGSFDEVVLHCPVVVNSAQRESSKSRKCVLGVCNCHDTGKSGKIFGIRRGRYAIQYIMGA